MIDNGGEFVIPGDFFASEIPDKGLVKKTRKYFGGLKKSKFTAEIHLKQTLDMDGPTGFKGNFYVSKNGNFLIHSWYKDTVIIPFTNIAYIKIIKLDPGLDDD